MEARSRHVRYYLVMVVGTTLAFTLAYNYGMAAFENRPQSLLNSMEVVFQTFTTVGYGEDAPWTSPIMNVLVMGMQATGVLLIFAALPVIVIPLIEDALETTPPTTVDELTDHVILCTYTRQSDALIDELNQQDIDYLIVEPERDTATTLHEQGHPVLHGDPELTETLRTAHVDDATALVADAADEVNVSIVLAAAEAADDIYTISIVEDPSLSDYHRYAGADRVFSSTQLLGEQLAEKVTTVRSMNVDDVVELDEAFDIVDVPLHEGSVLVGQTLSESDLAAQTGAAIVGAWVDGEFASPVPMNTALDADTTLLAVGREPQLDRLHELVRASTRPRPQRDRRVVIAGLGEVGSAVTDALTRAGIEQTTLDIEAKPDVDVTCDATNPEALHDADIESAHTVVLALPDDTDAVFATLLIRQLNPDVEIIARANNADNIPKLYRAGADYVLALARVSGRMVAADILPADTGVAQRTRTAITHTQAPKLAGRTLAEARVRERTGVSVIAVERDTEIRTGIEPSFTLRADDGLVVSGTPEAVDQFTDRWGDA